MSAGWNEGLIAQKSQIFQKILRRLGIALRPGPFMFRGKILLLTHGLAPLRRSESAVRRRPRHRPRTRIYRQKNGGRKIRRHISAPIFLSDSGKVHSPKACQIVKWKLPMNRDSRSADFRLQNRAPRDRRPSSLKAALRLAGSSRAQGAIAVGVGLSMDRSLVAAAVKRRDYSLRNRTAPSQAQQPGS